MVETLSLDGKPMVKTEKCRYNRPTHAIIFTAMYKDMIFNAKKFLSRTCKRGIMVKLPAAGFMQDRY